jgi:hypothetical protein
MADPTDGVDITTDLNSQGDAGPYHGDAIPQNQLPSKTPEVTPEGTENAPAPSLRDTLTDAFKGETAPKADAPAEDAVKPSVTPESAPAVPELVKVGDRWHRKDGSFASNEDIAAFNASQAGSEGQAAPVDKPWMQGLTSVEREQFTALPAETRQFVERTMDSVMQREAQYSEYELIEQVIGPRRQPWAEGGMTPIVALNQLFALSDFAGRDPAQFVLWFADQQRVNLDELLDQRDAIAEQQGAGDPRFIGLQQEIAQLRNTIGGFTNQTVQQQQAANLRLVQQFMDEKDAGGNLAHPYFNDVSNDVANHIALLRQQQPYLAETDLLKAAYDFATYNNPRIREEIQNKALKDAQDKAAAEAMRARQAGVSINGGPAGDTSQAPNNANRTLRDELVSAYNQSTLQ